MPARSLDYFSPQIQSALDSGNIDLGSGGLLLLPDQPGAHPHEMVSAGKNGTIYLVDRDNMGHFSSNNDQIVQSLINIFPNGTGRTRPGTTAPPSTSTAPSTSARSRTRPGLHS